MERYLIDTNEISDYFSASIVDAGMIFMDDVINVTPNISVIVQIELLCWKINFIIEQKVKGFISDCRILNIDFEVIKHGVNLRRGKKIKIPDAIIAATSLAYGYSLITSNEKDFTNIDGLKIINPQRL